MNRDPYISKGQLISLLKLSCFGEEVAVIRDNTKEKDWHRMLSTIVTLAYKIRDQRIAATDKREVETFYRRFKKTHLMLFTNDDYRAGSKLEPVEMVQIELEDLYELADKAMLLCLNCSQGEQVKKCPIANLYHKLGFPTLRNNPADGECEYRYDNEARPVTPQNRLLNDEEHII